MYSWFAEMYKAIILFWGQREEVLMLHSSRAQKLFGKDADYCSLIILGQVDHVTQPSKQTVNGHSQG